MRVYAVVAMGALMSGCTTPLTDLDRGSPPDESLARADRAVDSTVELVVGHDVQIGTDLRIELLEVTEDSRCPAGVACFWAGNARSVLGTNVEGTEGTYVLHSSDAAFLDGSREFTVGPYTITYVSLFPEPTEGVVVAQDEYRLTVLVTGGGV